MLALCRGNKEAGFLAKAIHFVSSSYPTFCFSGAVALQSGESVKPLLEFRERLYTRAAGSMSFRKGRHVVLKQAKRKMNVEETSFRLRLCRFYIVLFSFLFSSPPVFYSAGDSLNTAENKELACIIVLSCHVLELLLFIENFAAAFI